MTVLKELEEDWMIFETQDTYIDLVEPTDVDHLVEIYNSNTAFLATHLQKDTVTRQWIVGEIESMREAGFRSCKAVGKASGQAVGLIDFKVGAETYISLLMIHRHHANQGYGQQIYTAVEAYVRVSGCRSIRIDVVRSNSDSVLNFWVRNGFRIVDDITLSWEGVTLPAVVMKKTLLPV